jgi:hypothetical protein
MAHNGRDPNFAYFARCLMVPDLIRDLLQFNHNVVLCCPHLHVQVVAHPRAMPTEFLLEDRKPGFSAFQLRFEPRTFPAIHSVTLSEYAVEMQSECLGVERF